MYHSIINFAERDPYSIDVTLFQDHLNHLELKGYQFVSLAVFIKLRQKKKNGNLANTAVITFDDGYQDFYRVALPILRKRNLPATVFIIPGLLGQKSTWNEYRPDGLLMTKEEINAIQSEGIELGSHTMTHRSLVDLDDKELQFELGKSYQDLQLFGTSSIAFSYPWGKYTSNEIKAVKSAGYSCAVTTDPNLDPGKTSLYELGRYPVSRASTVSELERYLTSPLPKPALVTRFRNFAGRVRRKFLSNGVEDQ